METLYMAVIKSKFRGENNTRYTQQLFYEMSIELGPNRCTIEPMYSLHQDVDGLINFRKEYIKDMDPTGYKTATRLLENYDHFLFLMRSNWFKTAKAEWDKELAAKMEQEALDKLRGILNATESDIKPSERISAAKALLARSDALKASGEPQNAKKRGRPTKDEVAGALKEEIRLTKEEMEDLERIGLPLKLVNT